ncbi:hypothetical protein ACIRP2_39290 [Streptomyces sp. NPDC101194]|uniref:hypothetical protein n=1 Tax=Streptomyces sp. NPDC101194 TaxID=3366127 RepID=UPI003807BDC8
MELTDSQMEDAGEGNGAPVGPNQERTIALFLEQSRRMNRTVPIRRSFLQQQGRGEKTQAPMQVLVTRKQERALDLYLLLAAVTVSKESGFAVTEWSTSWARSLGIFEEKTGGAAVSRAWRALKELRIVATARGEGRRTRVTKLKEDGTGDAYEPPGAQGDAYFQLPFAYWNEGLNTKLSLPGKAMLLIALSQREYEFSLAHAQIQNWYGINKQTVAKGIHDLLAHEVIVRSGEQWYDTLQTKSGVGRRPLYQFADPFVQPGIARVRAPRNSSVQ